MTFRPFSCSRKKAGTKVAVAARFSCQSELKELSVNAYQKSAGGLVFRDVPDHGDAAQGSETVIEGEGFLFELD